MKIHEYQAKEILERYGIPVPRWQWLDNAKNASAAFQSLANPSCVLKVQVLMGGRGKAGGVRIIHTAQEAESAASELLGKAFSTYQSAGASETVRSLILTETIDIQSEYYLGVVIDRSHGTPVILFSAEGGVDIEDVAKKNPGAIVRIPFSPDEIPDDKRIAAAIGKRLLGKTLESVSGIAAKLARAFVEKDAAIAEINPLCLTKEDRVTALDAKFVFDDNALFRHEDLQKLKDPAEDDEREKRAKAAGLSYVSMTGNIGCLVNGAGLAMATMDVIKLAGGEPANFLDVGGGATAEQVTEAFKIILQDERVEAILVNIFGGIMKCDVIAQGVIQATREVKLAVPLIVRLEGTNVAAGRELLKNSGLPILSFATIHEAAQAAVKSAREFKESHVRLG